MRKAQLLAQVRPILILAVLPITVSLVMIAVWNRSHDPYTQSLQPRQKRAAVVQPLSVLDAKREVRASYLFKDKLDSKIFEPWRGDLAGMVKRRVIRMLVPHSLTFYFLDGAKERGILADAGRKFEEFINTRLGRKTLTLKLVFIPVARDQLIQGLLDGRGDIAAGALTVTPKRKTQVEFTVPTYQGVSEVLVTGPKSSRIDGLDDLSGREVFVRKSSSAYELLNTLSSKFRKRDLAPVKIRFVDEQLEPEDILEMVNAGLIPMTVVSEPLAKFWAQIFTKATVRSDVAIASGGDLAWALRKKSPTLKRYLDDFVRKHRAGTTYGNILLSRYLKDQTWVKNVNATEERKRFTKVVNLFERYGNRYNFDYLLLAAQGYQESKLDHSARSRAGAIGIMQLLPKTGASMNVGDIHKVEPNIHAGAKYLRFVTDRYFADEPMSKLDKALFALAAYNAGPARIAKLRSEAKARGLNPNKWFDNVELIAAKRVGREPVQYVSNIYKYYLAYSMVEQRKRG